MATNTEEYLNGLPEKQRTALQRLRETILSLVPEAVESISTNVPAFRYKDKYLVSIDATKKHLSLLVMQGDALKSLSDELEAYDAGSRIVRFTPENPLPAGLVERIVKFRQTEIDESQRYRSSPRFE